MSVLVLKIGGELIDTPAALARMAAVIARLAAAGPLVVVHGGGRAVDVELARRGLVPSKVDGVRVTDADTLEVVVAVLAGSANTSFVASLVAAGVPAVGLTGVDAGFGRARRAHAHRAVSGAVVDLGLVGDPEVIDGALIDLLVSEGYVPVIASLGLASGGEAAILNVNADVMACRVAAAQEEADLVIAGTTPGVLDDRGRPIESIDIDSMSALITSGTATAGMVAKLSACRDALAAGVRSVRIVDGRSLDASLSNPLASAPGTNFHSRMPVASSLLTSDV